jgi:hypothetical protein
MNSLSIHRVEMTRVEPAHTLTGSSVWAQTIYVHTDGNGLTEVVLFGSPEALIPSEDAQIARLREQNDALLAACRKTFRWLNTMLDDDGSLRATDLMALLDAVIEDADAAMGGAS